MDLRSDLPRGSTSATKPLSDNHFRTGQRPLSVSNVQIWPSAPLKSISSSEKAGMNYSPQPFYSSLLCSGQSSLRELLSLFLYPRACVCVCEGTHTFKCTLMKPIFSYLRRASSDLHFLVWFLQADASGVFSVSELCLHDLLQSFPLHC